MVPIVQHRTLHVHVGEVLRRVALRQAIFQREGAKARSGDGK
jgi:hypothetical protein